MSWSLDFDSVYIPTAANCKWCCPRGKLIPPTTTIQLRNDRRNKEIPLRYPNQTESPPDSRSRQTNSIDWLKASILFDVNREKQFPYKTKKHKCRSQPLASILDPDQKEQKQMAREVDAARRLIAGRWVELFCRRGHKKEDIHSTWLGSAIDFARALDDCPCCFLDLLHLWWRMSEQMGREVLWDSGRLMRLICLGRLFGWVE